MKKFTTGIFISLIALVAIFASAPTAHAATGIYLTPSSGTYAPGATFNVQLRLASDSPGVQANLTFDRTKLQITNVSKQGSDFSNNTTDINNNDGTITVYAINGGFGDKSDQLVSTFTFQAISGGEAPLTFTGTNRTLRYVLLVGLWTDATTTNASYTITGGGSTPPVTPPVNGGGTTTAPKPNPSTSKPAPTSPTTPTTPPVAGGAPAAPVQETPSPDTPVSSDEPSKTPAIQLPTKSDVKQQAQEATTSIGPTTSAFPWIIVAIVAGVIALATLIGLLVYRNSHMSKALQRLIAAVIEYRLAFNQQAATIHPALAAPVIMPKLLAFTAPKLLGSGIKQKLLAAGSKIPGVDRFIQR